MSVTAEQIVAKAAELGFAGCGIISLGVLAEYKHRLDQRIRDCPGSKPILEPLRRYAAPDTTYPWAKAVIVCVTDYAAYRVPDTLKGRIGAYYLFDHKLQPSAPGSVRITAFEQALDVMGVRWAKELHGVTSMRMAAEKAGLGVIRKNNFLYTEKGSRTILDTWAIDQELEWKEHSSQKPCPEGCHACIDACPTHALRGPNCMDASSCITLMTWGARDLPAPEAIEKTGAWIYGCDECQNACPFNKKAEESPRDYPGLKRLADTLTLPGILAMDEATMKELLLPKFWFIQSEKLWLWKVNALRAMANAYKPEYRQSIIDAESDSDPHVREMAKRVGTRMGTNGAEGTMD